MRDNGEDEERRHNKRANSISTSDVMRKQANRIKQLEKDARFANKAKGKTKIIKNYGLWLYTIHGGGLQTGIQGLFQDSQYSFKVNQ